MMALHSVVVTTRLLRYGAVILAVILVPLNDDVVQRDARRDVPSWASAWTAVDMPVLNGKGSLSGG